MAAMDAEQGAIVSDNEAVEMESVEGECILDFEVDRDHEWWHGVFISFSLSLCITVDILQYSMPLAFLPSVLEDRGHAPMKIATAIGIYYWTGFLGGVIITSYQVWRVLSGEGLDKKGEDGITIRTARRHIRYLIYGLLLGTATLICQSLSPHYQVHLYCRFVQGLAGAFLFFYTFLLSVSLFKEETDLRTFAMTSAATALNVAEVLGSFLGAVIYDVYGQKMVFWSLGLVSIVNQALLVVVVVRLKPNRKMAADRLERENSESVVSTTESAKLRRANSGWERLMSLLRSTRLGCSVLLIVTAAVVKGSVEEMLPFHADHQWHYDPLRIGLLFSIVAVAYILSAILTGKMWACLGRFRVTFAAVWLSLLSLAAYGAFATRSYTHDERVLYAFLIMYGACLGFTHTPAALLLGDAIDHEEGPAKDAANGIWNTMWEAGGSVGFLLGGVLAHNYANQLELLAGYVVLCTSSAAGLLVLSHFMPGEKRSSLASLGVDGENEADYGATKKDDDMIKDGMNDVIKQS